jgi:hypothetical protein
MRFLPPGRWLQQPRGPLVIARNSFTRGLNIALVPARAPRNIVDGLRYATPTYPIAQSIYGDVGYPAEQLGTNWVKNTAAYSYMLMLVTGPTKSAGVYSPFGCGGASNNVGFGFYADHTNSSYRGAVTHGSGYTIIGQPFGATSLATNTMYQLGVTFDGTKAATYAYGSYVAPSNSSPGATSSGNQQYGLGAASDGTSTAASAGWSTAQILYAYVWNRALTAGEIAEITAFPWGTIFQRAPQTMYFLGASSGGTSFSGTPGLGSLVKTGKINTLTINYKFVPAVGSIAKTGQIPVITKAFKFAPGAGSIVKTGQIPTLTKGFVFNPISGSLVKTGQIPTLTRKFFFTPLSGSIIKSGQRPSLAVTFNPGTGSLVKTGYAPNLTISGQVTVPQTKKSWFVKAIGVKTKIGVNSQVDSDTGDTP